MVWNSNEQVQVGVKHLQISKKHGVGECSSHLTQMENLYSSNWGYLKHSCFDSLASGFSAPRHSRAAEREPRCEVVFSFTLTAPKTAAKMTLWYKYPLTQPIILWAHVWKRQMQTSVWIACSENKLYTYLYGFYWFKTGQMSFRFWLTIFLHKVNRVRYSGVTKLFTLWNSKINIQIIFFKTKTYFAKVNIH